MFAWDDSVSHDERLAKIIAAHTDGKEIDPAKLLDFLRPILSRSEDGPRLTPTQLSAYEHLSRDERDVLIRCLEVLRTEAMEICSRLHGDID